MSFNVQVLAVTNLIVQILLMVTVFAAAYLAKMKRQLIGHCTIMRIAVPVQIVTVVAIMLPSMLGYIESEATGLLFSLEIPVHHVLGLIVVALWLYVNLVFRGIIKVRARLVLPMRLAFGAWLATLILGLHIYLRIWV